MRQNRGLYIARRAGHTPSPAQHLAGGVKATCPGFLHALEALDGPPLTAEERAAHRSAVARVKAADDARRAPAPQLSLPEAA